MRTMKRATFVFAAVLAVAVQTAPAAAQHSEEFSWNRAMTAGRTIEIKGVNGNISAVMTHGSEVRVRAQKHSKKSNVSEVRMQVMETPNGVTICAVYPTPTRGRGRP